MVVVMALIFKSILGSFDAAFFMSAMLPPGILFAKYFSSDISFKNCGTGILHIVYFISIVLLIEYLAIMTVYWILYGFSRPEETDILLNPVFIWFILAALFSIEKILKTTFFQGEAEEKHISFTSERVKVSLEIDSIAYIESRDYEVLVMTASGKSYPTRMKISQWESVLDSRFVRIHRSFIVNRKQITRYDSRAVYLGEQTIEFSRKYKEPALHKLGQ